MEPGKVAMEFLVEGGRVLYRAVARTISEVMAGGRMSRAEAEQILDVAPRQGDSVARNSFLRMYTANARENGGSPYLQSKILAAYSVLSGSKPDPKSLGDACWKRSPQRQSGVRK